MAEEVGKEPGGWELYRGIERIEQTLERLNGQSMTTATFAIEKAAILATIAGQGKEIGELRAAAVSDRQTIEQNRKAAEEQKARNRLFIYGLIGGPIATGVIAFIIAGGLTR